MSQIDKIMLLADEWADKCATLLYVPEDSPRRQALRAAIEQAIKDEREACAQLCTPNFIGEYPPGSGRDDRYDLAKADCAAAIRGRGV